MTRLPRIRLLALLLVLSAVLASGAAAQESAKSDAPAATAFDRLAALAGDWIDVEGTFGTKDQVAVLYRLTGNKSAVVETLFPGQPHEMVTVYHKDGNDLVLTHYCATGNQPRMRAKTVTGDRISFDFDGGTNLDPAVDVHMHQTWMEFLSKDEIRGEWIGWDKGKPSDHIVKYHIRRKVD